MSLFVCDEPGCAFTTEHAKALGSHRRYKHGIRGTSHEPADIAAKQRAYYEANRDEPAAKPGACAWCAVGNHALCMRPCSCCGNPRSVAS